MSVCDKRGKTFALRTAPKRVVSLVPSVTETLFDLDVGDTVVGITRFCLFPQESVAALPKVGGTKKVRLAALRALAPDLVHMNAEENRREDAEAIEGFAPVFVSEPKSPRDVIALIRDLGALHRAERRAEFFATQIEDELRQATDAARPFTFACPIWKDPWMWCGGDTYVSQLIEAAGGRNILGQLGRYPTLTIDDVLARAPEVIFLPDEPYAFTEDDAAALRAGGPRCVVGPFPGHLVTWHGTRTALGLQWLRRALPGL